MNIKNLVTPITISFCALIVSILAIAVSFNFQRKQDKRWEQLNSPNPQLKEATMTTFKELTLDEAKKTKWGYNLKYYSKGETIDKFIIPFYLIAKDKVGHKVENIYPVFTISEMKNELKRLNIKSPVGSYKRFKPKFTIENMGKTEARNLTIDIEAKLPKENWQNAFSDKAVVNLAASQSSSVSFEFDNNVAIELPDQILCRIHLKYQDSNNKNFKKVVHAKWTSNDNIWSYAAITD